MSFFPSGSEGGHLDAGSQVPSPNSVFFDVTNKDSWRVSIDPTEEEATQQTSNNRPWQRGLSGFQLRQLTDQDLQQYYLMERRELARHGGDASLMYRPVQHSTSTTAAVPAASQVVQPPAASVGNNFRL